MHNYVIVSRSDDTEYDHLTLLYCISIIIMIKLGNTTCMYMYEILIIIIIMPIVP